MTGGSHHKLLPGYRNTLYLVQYLSEGKEALEVSTEFVVLVIETSYQLSPKGRTWGWAVYRLMVRLCSGLDSLQQGVGGTPSRETHQCAFAESHDPSRPARLDEDKSFR